jgi:hypothetical protein
LVVDPIDGTRGLMHDKRSAWFLAGLCPQSSAPTLRNLSHACLIELPHARSSLSDIFLWGPGDRCSWTENLDTGARRPLPPSPTQAKDLSHGFATVNRFLWRDSGFWGLFQERLIERLYPHDADSGRKIFEDQYISNAGQMHGLITGRDRLVIDLRPLAPHLGAPPSLSSHPYDLLGLPIAEAAGVIITDARGQPLDAPLNLTERVPWIGYGNRALQKWIEPHLVQVLESLGVSS